MSWFKRGWNAEVDVVGMSAIDARSKKGFMTKQECPDCMSKMKIQTSNKSGVPFLGCSAFPECKGTVFAWGYKGEVTPEVDPTVPIDHYESGEGFMYDAAGFDGGGWGDW